MSAQKEIKWNGYGEGRGEKAGVRDGDDHACGRPEGIEDNIFTRHTEIGHVGEVRGKTNANPREALLLVKGSAGNKKRIIEK